jgi:GPI mannosyltransferase 3
MRFKFLKACPNEIIFCLAAMIYLITAWNSHGFYHADEHYQIIEFAGLKSGTHSPGELAWEYHAKIRSSLMPSMAYLIFEAATFFKITDPYKQAFILRLITAILSLLTINYFVKQTEKLFLSRRTKGFYHLLSFFLWFVPFLSVRFSSETWSGLFFLLSLSVFHDPKNGQFKPYLIGLFLGLGFLVRFQTALLMVGFLAYLVFVQKKHVGYLMKIMLTFLLILFVGILLDRWYYGEWTITSWNYLNNTILEDSGLGFGTSSGFFYLLKLIQLPTYFIGVPLVLSIILLLFKTPKNIYIWSIVPFILVHSIIPHKEERFMFPIVYLLPIIMFSAHSFVLTYFKNTNTTRMINYFLVSILILVNSVGLFAMAQKSAGIGRMEISKFIHDKYIGKRINLIYCPWANPYNPWQNLPMKFYLEKGMVEKHINALSELNDSLLIKNAENLLVIRKADFEKQGSQQVLDSFKFIFEKQSIPAWQERVNRSYKGFNDFDIIMLYRRNR